MLEEIFQKIKEKGWNLYQMQPNDTIFTSVPKGPAQSLEIGKEYVLFPKIKEPTDVHAMETALKQMSATENFPLISYHQQPLAIAYLHVKDRDIVIHDVTDEIIEYQSLLFALDSLTPNKTADLPHK